MKLNKLKYPLIILVVLFALIFVLFVPLSITNLSIINVEKSVCESGLITVNEPATFGEYIDEYCDFDADANFQDFNASFPELVENIDFGAPNDLFVGKGDASWCLENTMPEGTVYVLFDDTSSFMAFARIFNSIQTDDVPVFISCLDLISEEVNRDTIERKEDIVSNNIAYTYVGEDTSDVINIEDGDIYMCAPDESIVLMKKDYYETSYLDKYSVCIPPEVEEEEAEIFNCYIPTLDSDGDFNSCVQVQSPTTCDFIDEDACLESVNKFKKTLFQKFLLWLSELVGGTT